MINVSGFSKTRLRVLLVAEAANPEWPSVPLVGWSHSRAIGKLTDAHLITQVRNRDAILRAGLVEGRDFTAIDSEAVAGRLYQAASLIRGGTGKSWTTATAFAAISYYYFEYLLWKQFGARITGGEFDVVHRLTPLSPAIPSLIARKCQKAGVPFVLGPLNGGLPWPKGFDRERHKEREWLSCVRKIYKLLPGYRSTLRASSLIFVGSKFMLEQIPARYRSRCVYLPENAVDPSRFSLRREKEVERPIRVIFVGRLVPLKGVDMLLEAAAPEIRSGDLTIEIIGDGPEKERLKVLVEREGITGGVTFGGWLSHDRVQERMVAADVLVFPSIREFGGGVVLEAMAVGLVPIVVNYGGPGELVTEETGYLLEMAPRPRLVSQLREVLTGLVKDSSPLEKKSEAARKRVAEAFTWDAKARQVVDLYMSLVGAAQGAEWASPAVEHVETVGAASGKS